MPHDNCSSTSEITDQMIADRAYHLWQSRGCPQSDGQHDWEVARQQLESENRGAWGSLRRVLARLRTRVA
jgi:hypothetical protein